MNNDFNQYLVSSPMVDFEHPSIQSLIERKGWRALPPFRAIKAIYNFVRDDILFGYNFDDTIPASQVLKDGYGQCNTKGTLLIALLRAVGVHTRFHGFTIDNQLQKGAIPAYLFVAAPKELSIAGLKFGMGINGGRLKVISSTVITFLGYSNDSQTNVMPFVVMELRLHAYKIRKMIGMVGTPIFSEKVLSMTLVFTLTLMLFMPKKGVT